MQASLTTWVKVRYGLLLGVSGVSVCFGSENFLEFSVLNCRVLREEFRLLLLKVIERALVVLCEAVLGAEHVSTFTGHLKQTDFLAARPALVSVRLKGNHKLKPIQLNRHRFRLGRNKI